MAVTEQFVLKVQADLGNALREVKRLEQEIKDLKRAAATEIEIEVDADAAKRTISDLISDVDKLSSDEAKIVLALNGAKIQGEISEVRAKIADLNTKPAEVEIEIARLAQLTGDFDQISAKIKEIDTAKAEVTVTADTSQVEGGLSRARQSTDDLSGSARGANSALANMIGNSAQDLGALTGLAGSAGVAIGQMAEYAADASLGTESIGKSLGSMAAVAGPIAALSAATFLASKAIEAFGTKSERTAKMTQETSDAILEQSDAVNTLNDALGNINYGGALTAQQQFLAGLFETPEAANAAVAAADRLGIKVTGLGDIFVAMEADSSAALEGLALSAMGLSGPLSEQEVEIARIMAEIVDGTEGGEESFRLFKQAAEEAGIPPEVLDSYEQMFNDLEAINDAQQDTDANEVAKKQLVIAESLAAVNDEYARYLQQAKERAGVGASEFEIWSEYVDIVNEAVAADEALIARDAALLEAHEANTAAAKALADEQDRMTFTTDELSEALQGLEDPLNTMPGLWDQLISMFREGGPDALLASEEAINRLAEATNLEPGDVLGIIAEQAGELDAAAAEAAEELANLNFELAQLAGEFNTVERRADAAATAIGSITEGSDLMRGERVVSFVDNMRSLTGALDDARDAGIDFSEVDIAPDSWDEVLNMPEELRPVAEALRAFKADVDTGMTEAFAAGGSVQAREWAQRTRVAVANEIQGMGLDAEEELALINQAWDELNLTDEEVTLFIKLAGEEQARLALAGLSSIIAGFDPEVQIRITALAATDPLAALRLTIQTLVDQGVEVPVEMIALLDQLEMDILGYDAPPIKASVELGSTAGLDAGLKAYVPRTIDVPVSVDLGSLGRALSSDKTGPGANVAGPTVTVTTTLDDTAVIDGLTDITEAEWTATVEGDPDLRHADSEFTRFVNTPREPVIKGDPDLSAANSEFTQFVAAERTAKIKAEALTAAADIALGILERDRIADIFAMPHAHEYVEGLLNNIARDRTATIYVRTVGTAAIPSGGGGGGATQNAFVPESLAVESFAVGPEAMADTTVPAVPVGGGSGSGFVSVSAPAPVINNTYQINLRAGVVGDRFAIQRAVSNAVRSAERLGGTRR